MNVLKQIGLTFGWLSGALAGIGAFLYCFGYLITAADLHLLGLDIFIFNYKPSFYIGRGATFFVYQFLAISGLLLSLAPGLIPLLLVGGLYVLLRRRLGRRIRGKRWLVRGRRWRRRLGASVWFRQTAAALLLFVLLIYLSTIRETITAPLQISGILHGPAAEPCAQATHPDHAAWSITEKIVCWLHTGNTKALQTRFHEALLAEVFVVGCLLIAWYVVTRTGLSKLILAPFILAVIVIVMLLPMIYGVLMLPREFPSIRLVPKDQALLARPAHLYLLHKTDSDLVLWNATTHRVVWVPLGTLLAAEIGRSRQLSEIITLQEDTP
jgi:hypothetical protein